MAASTGTLRGHLRGERRALARATETGTAGRSPAQGITLAIGNRDDGVVEGRVDVRNPIYHGLFDFLRVLLAPGLAILSSYSNINTALRCSYTKSDSICLFSTSKVLALPVPENCLGNYYYEGLAVN